jgi:Protein of unknown function (DUF2934)
MDFLDSIFHLQGESMNKYTTRSEATQSLAAGQTHDDLQRGRGVIAVPTHNDIAHRAYDIYVKNGWKQGQCKQNWHQAEKELRMPGRQA